MFQITREQARQIIKNYNRCPEAYDSLKMGVNPRGLRTQILWQIDVTHISEFGKLEYVHVTINTYSQAVMATTRTGEAVKDVIQHLIACSLVLGLPQKIKTDNTPAYTSQAFNKFCQAWGIVHSTRIPYNPQGQTIIERAHQNIKLQLQRLKASNQYYSPHQLLNHALFTINHLNTNEEGLIPMQRHWGPRLLKIQPKVYWKDLLTDTWKGPDVLITSGRGYACVFPQDAEAPIWIPDTLIRPGNEDPDRSKKKAQSTNQKNDTETEEAPPLCPTNEDNKRSETSHLGPDKKTDS